MTGFCTLSQYIDKRSALRDKIKAIDEILSAMELKLLDVGESVVYDEYSMNDGQMTVRAKYRSADDVLKGITGLEQLKQRYLNRLQGRSVVLRGGNF